MAERKLYGLIGFPLGHSFSVPYFTEKFRIEGIHARYRNFPMEKVDDFRNLLAEEHELCGLNVTVPHKEGIIPFLDELDPQAAAIGAVNTIAFGEVSGVRQLVGYNTDVIGFRASLEARLEVLPDRALVLGTGGSSKAVCFVLEQLGVKFFQVSRRPGSGLITYGELEGALVRSCGLVVNTTPLGMHPKADTCPDIPYTALGTEHLLYDLVYNPARTLFLRKGEEQGSQIMNGHDMLIRQAEASWRIWNSLSP
jgi:shikimate dehydrogenase